MNLNAIIVQLLAIAKNDALKSVLPLLAQFFTSISTDPTALNIAAQLASLEVGILAALPGIAQDELKGLADIVNTELQTLKTTHTP